MQLARDRCDLSLAGNHDLVVTGDIPISDFSASAAAAARWTQETISEETMAYLKGPQARGPEPRAGALPREPARPGLGIRALDLAGGRVHRR